MIAPEKTPWYAEGLRFTCTQCGNCCSGPPGYVWINDEELRALAAHFGLTPIEFEQRHTRRAHGRRSLLEQSNGDCEFLRRDPDGKRRCSVYLTRPLQCRTWPFWRSNVDSPRAWERAARACPGMNQGEHHPLPVIQAALRRNDAAELPL